MRRARERFAVALFEKAFDTPNPVVVDIKEEFIPKEVDYFFTSDPSRFENLSTEYRISAKIQSVQHQHIIIGVPDYVSKKLSFWEKLKWLFSR